jgi:hypothetical protein
MDGKFSEMLPSPLVHTVLIVSLGNFDRQWFDCNQMTNQQMTPPLSPLEVELGLASVTACPQQTKHNLSFNSPIRILNLMSLTLLELLSLFNGKGAIMFSMGHILYSNEHH